MRLRRPHPFEFGIATFAALALLAVLRGQWEIAFVASAGALFAGEALKLERLVRQLREAGAQDALARLYYEWLVGRFKFPAESHPQAPIIMKRVQMVDMNVSWPILLEPQIKWGGELVLRHSPGGGGVDIMMRNRTDKDKGLPA